MKDKLISWGIIGCGDVAEVKSGPAFNRADNSELIAVMRRDGAKAKDFARRHHVPLWYDNASQLLANQEINAVYIATPPSSHLEYALQALEAGKHVYLEKPMVLSREEADLLQAAVSKSEGKLVVAHYRRGLPMYVRVKQLLNEEKIGEIKFVDLRFLQPNDPSAQSNWRYNPEISGGGLFHDLAPHQLDLMYHFFGGFGQASGYASDQGQKDQVHHIVNGIISFDSGVQLRGIWHFDMPSDLEEDNCTIYGSRGTLSFSFYENELIITCDGQQERVRFENPKHIQEPFIQQTVNYFLGLQSNPCSVKEGMDVIRLMDVFTKK